MRGVEDLPRSVAREDVLVVDEAHHSPAATWGRIVREWPGPVLGLTATPWRLDPLQSFTGYYSTLLQGGSTLDLVAAGYLTPPEIVTAGLVRGGKVTAGEYAAEDVDVSVLATARVVELWGDAVGAGTPTVWYTPTVHAAEVLSATLARAGIEAPVLHSGSSPDDRKRAMGRFAAGRVDHLVNVDVLGEGVDVPRIGAVVLARPTHSLTWWLQAAGRAVRLAPGKTRAVILDLAASKSDDENVEAWCGPGEVYSSPFARRRWSLHARAFPQGGEVPWSSCIMSACGRPIHPAAHFCEACGMPQYTRCGECSRDVRLSTVTYEGVCERCAAIAGEKLVARVA